MENKRSKLFPILILVSLTTMFSFSEAYNEKLPETEAGQESNHDTYIVFVNKPKGQVFAQSQDLDNWYESFLPVTTSSSDQRRRLVFSYRNVVTGFAAKLTEAEAKEMEQKDGFLSARPQKILPLHTTRTPGFLGLHQNFGVWNDSNYGEGVIVGVLDTGITPDHPSFSDEGMPPVPDRWKGKCELNGTRCNNKLIGARNFVDNVYPPETPIDSEGHGTHTTSTAAGNFVKNANVFNNAKGTAVGMAPLAHVAMYKVCSDFGCSESAILAAMDAAVEEGVDVLSLSLGGPSGPFYSDGIAIGAFGAIQKGVFVSCSAGNSGPANTSLSNEAPWILTVGASTIDRSIRSEVRLGNNRVFFGESLSETSHSQVFWPLVYAGNNGSELSNYCGPQSFKNYDVKGKIVVCERGGGVGRIDKGQEVKNAGGVGMVLVNDELNAYSTLVDAHVLPASHVSYADGLKIKAYINSTATPTAALSFVGTILGSNIAPVVTSFSSRGPSYASPGILKPDIMGPGVSILAAWPVSVENNTNATATFNIVSGTSMSCPHLSGVAALLKSIYPDWSPAAIKSAIMTSADLVNLGGNPILDERLLPADILATGAGHVNPSKARDPGLVYDIEPDDYIPYLCGLGYGDREVGFIVQRQVKCSDLSIIPEAELNYPSFSIILGAGTQTYTRTVTNVGPSNSTYAVSISPPPGVMVTVTPNKLEFSDVKQTALYSVTFSKTSENVGKPISQGFLTWASDHGHSVRSPILSTFSN